MRKKMTGRTIQMLVPTAQPSKALEALAPRIGSLDNKVIGILDNRWSAYTIFLNRLEQLLSDRHPSSKPIRRTKMTKSVGASQGMIGELASSCQAIINGLGG